MKLLLKIIILLLSFTFSNCNKKSEDIDYTNRAKFLFLNIVHKGYHKDGKYFLSGCSESFGGLEKEIKKNDKFNGYGGMHGEAMIFKAEDLTKDSLVFSFEQHFSQRSKQPIERGRFSIRCFEEKDIILDFKIEGIQVNKEGAKKHISEGKFYRIIPKDFSPQKNGVQKYLDACTKDAISKYGFQEYHFADCIPIEKCYQKIEEYNDTIFNHLVQLPKNNFKDFESMNIAFEEEIINCRK